MDLQTNLIESKKGQFNRKRLTTSIVSIVLHALLVATFIYVGAQHVAQKAEAEPIRAFLSEGAAPPPPPPPPPPAKSSGAPKQSTPKPVEMPQPMMSSALTPPTEIKELPTPVQTMPDPGPVTEEPAGGTDDAAGVEGGVEGGVAGGVVGGEVGGTVGGEVGGVIGGQLGGQLGGTGTGNEGTGTGPAEPAPPPPPPPPPPPTAPLRVGGDVKAPVTIARADPEYTEGARKAKIAGIVVVEAIIDKQGNVDEVRVIKGLPMGLSEEAEKAVRKWKFRPGSLNGQPVATIFNLTVNFKLN